MSVVLNTANQVADWGKSHLSGLAKNLFIGVRRGVGNLYTSWRKGLIAQILFYLKCGHFFRHTIFESYLESNETYRLQVGGGMHPKKGWLNADIIAGDFYLNATKPFPFP